jgi:glyoxylase-like metal-dependent hydrolase (beta-lactamase superfamily II)
MPTATSSMLKWDVLVTNRQGLTRDLPPGKEKWMWVPTSATLIYGERDAVLVDAFLTIDQARAAVEWVAASGKNLTTIYVTHGHGDHFFGIGALLDRFPNAKAVATANVLKVMRRQMSPEFVASFWKARYPSQIPEHLVLPEELQGNVIDLEGRELVAVEVGIPTPTTRRVFTCHQSGWSSLATLPTTMFTSTSPSQTRKLAASGSLRSTPLRR